MSEFRKYEHVEKLDKDEVSGILVGTSYVFAKLDGTNASVWSDAEGNIHCGSRTREITPENDNAGFAEWAINSDHPEAQLIRTMCRNNKEWIVYGEWGVGKVGTLKTYVDEAKGKLWVFDIYSRELERYLDFIEYGAAMEMYGLVGYEAVLLGAPINATQEVIQSIADNNTFLMQEGSIGEGVVIKRYDYRNRYNRYAIGKYVRPQYKASQTTRTRKMVEGEIEASIISRYLTGEELGKAKAKVILACEAEEFDLHNGKMIGMFMNLCWKDMLEENIVDAVKRAHMPTINFSVLNTLCKEKCRQFLGL